MDDNEGERVKDKKFMGVLNAQTNKAPNASAQRPISKIDRSDDDGGELDER